MQDVKDFWFSEYDKYGLATLLIDIGTGQILKANAEVIELLRITKETPSSLEGRFFMDLYALSNLGVLCKQERFAPEFFVIVRREKCTHRIIRFYRPDGGDTLLDITVFPLRDSGAAIVIMQPYNNIEETLAITTLQKELEDEQRRSHLMIESAPFGCVVFDKQFQPISCNAVCVSLFKETSKTSLLANLKNYLFEGVTTVNQKEFYKNILENLYATGSFQMNGTHLTADGCYFETSMTLSLIKYRGEDQIVVYLVDMSEQRKVLDMYAKLALEASKDQLTGVKNRGHFDMKINLMMQSHMHTKKPLYLVMLDIDNFKQINDTYGHVAGDEVLRDLGAVLCDTIRPVDSISRYGGEEFVILLENMSITAVKHKLEALREFIASMNFKLPCVCNSITLPVTVSIGVAQYNPETMPDAETFCACADKALYKAKQEGKNCVRIYGE